MTRETQIMKLNLRQVLFLPGSLPAGSLTQKRVANFRPIRVALVVGIALAVGLLSTDQSLAQTSERPNIILIMADDIGQECFTTYGGQQYSTPRLDEMAREGMRFTQCHSQPLCTPSRVKLMTGLANVRNYSAFSILNPNQTTIGEYFQQAGYRTAIGGKWQLFGADHYDPRFRGRGMLPEEAGFDRHCLWQVDQLGSRYWGPTLRIDGKTKTFADDVYGPEVVIDFFKSFIRDSKDEPFFVYYPMILVHNPFEPTPDSASREQTDRQQNFADMVKTMDRLVGELIDQVDQLGLKERTLILFTTDNGTNRAIQSRWRDQVVRGGKGLTNNRGTHVPMFVRWPGVTPQGSTCDDLVDLSDLLPTLLQASGQPAPANCDGVSFLSQLQGNEGTPRSWLYCFYCPRPEKTKPVQFVRNERFKLYRDGRFYDLSVDPEETGVLEVVPSSDGVTRAAYETLLEALEEFPEQGERLLELGPQRFSPEGRASR